MEENTPISFCPRTQGDGMESMEVPITSDVKSACVNSTINAMQSLSLMQVKSPPAERVINLVPKSCKPEMKQKSTASNIDNKKTKFVPYEPYKAATKPIVPFKKKSINKGPSQAESSHVLEKSLSDGKKAPMADSSLISKEEYTRLIKEKEELEAELKIQSKVNAELKRLLVASVGEDMEARVHFLTEDKVKLADDIRQYVEKIAIDFEQKEKLSIEADVWRSKFLASSVVIDELTKWKAALCNRNNNLQLCVQSLFDEMNSIQNHQQQTYNHIKAMNRAFHPLGNSGQGPETVAHDVVQLSVSILKHVESLSKRLLGSYTQVREEEGAVSTSNTGPPKLSPSQLAAQEVLAMHPIGSCTMTELTNDMTAHHVAALARRSMNKSFYTCCPHCTGQVHVV